MSDDGPDRVEMLEKRMDAMSTRCDRQQELIEHLQERVADLESRTHPDAMDYDRMDKADKVEAVATYLYRKAQSADAATYGAKYDEVTAVFSGRMSDGGAYSIMEALGKRAGYSHRTDTDGPAKIVCSPEDVNDDTVLSGLKKNAADTPA